jgi:hypothetical protein
MHISEQLCHTSDLYLCCWAWWTDSLMYENSCLRVIIIRFLPLYSVQWSPHSVPVLCSPTPVSDLHSTDSVVTDFSEYPLQWSLTFQFPIWCPFSAVTMLIKNPCARNLLILKNSVIWATWRREWIQRTKFTSGSGPCSAGYSRTLVPWISDRAKLRG